MSPCFSAKSRLFRRGLDGGDGPARGAVSLELFLGQRGPKHHHRLCRPWGDSGRAKVVEAKSGTGSRRRVDKPQMGFVEARWLYYYSTASGGGGGGDRTIAPAQTLSTSTSKAK